jgi:hexulose-6-phosphate isomerase
VGPFEAGAPVIADYEATFERALEDFAALAAEAADYDVVLAIETVWNKCLTSPLEMRACVDGVDSASGLEASHVGVYLDVANVLRTGYPEHWIRVLGPRIQGVHFKDFAVGVGNLRGFVDLLRGDVDFGAVMAALRAIDYQGYGVVEMAPDPRTAAHRIRQAAQDMAYILKL